MAGTAPGRGATAEPPTLELVLKRNGVERLKREKSPLGMLDELPALIAAGYADVPEEDIVRLKWWGLYHDKPKVGTFMLRIKLAAGRLTPAQLRAIGQLSIDHGKGEAELTTRQNVQLHYLRLAELPDVFEKLHAAGLTSLGGCGDAVRAITGCPVAGIAHDELFDATPVVEEAHAFFTGHPDYVDLPRKHKIAIGACVDRCFAPEINCISLVGVLRDGEPGFGVLVGGGLSSVPRIARDLGVFVRPDEAIPVLRALLDAWREDLRYRVSRVKSRMKFMVDDLGPEGMRAEVERRLGYALPDFPLPPLDGQFADHVGVQPQKQEGLTAIGIPVHLGLVSGEQLLAIAELLEELGGEARVTRQQNLVLANVPDAAVDATVARLARARAAARHEPDPRRLDRVHRRAALQLLRDRDQDPPRLARRRARGALRRRRRAAPPAPRRMPARVRAALGRRPRLPGHHRARRGRQAPAGLRRLPPGRARAAGRDRPTRVPPRPDAGPRRARRPPGVRLARATRGRRGLPVVLRPGRRRRAGRARRPRAGEGPGCERGGCMSTVELLDDFEAGELSVEFEGREPWELLEWALDRFGDGLSLSTAFQEGDVALIDMAYRIDPAVRVFSIDTGRLPQETFDLIEALRERYPGLRLELLSPEAEQVQRLVDRNGPNLFRQSVELRLLCCNVRKVQPLNRALAGLDAWVTGLRRDQWASRSDIRKVEIDHDHDAIVKLNPLAEWTEEEVWDYLRENDVPVHGLYAKGYTSIGCSPCTRAIAPGEPTRAGRWWWESNAPKECGMHCAIETGGFEHELHAILGDEAHA